MLIFQVGDTIFHFLGNLLIGSYSALSTNILALIRNVINIRGKVNNIILSIITILIIIVGLSINSKGLIGLLPIIASVEYTFFLSKFENVQILRISLTANMVLWLIHDIYVRLYPSALMQFLIITITLINTFRYKKNK